MLALLYPSRRVMDDSIRRLDPFQAYSDRQNVMFCLMVMGY